jgi:hypothetical protein
MDRDQNPRKNLETNERPEPGEPRDEERATVTDVPFPRSYWVRRSHFLAGCYPGARDTFQARGKLEALLRVGVRTVVNLTEPGEIGHDGSPLRAYEAILAQAGEQMGVEARMLRCSIPDVSITTPEHMTSILDAIDGEITHGSPVYVHCWGGRGRTGTVVGCWLARHGYVTGDDALEYIRKLRCGVPDRAMPSPETSSQCEMVRRWKIGQ